MSKNLISLLLTICMLFCLSACGTTKISSNPTDTLSESQMNTAQDTYENTSAEEINQESSNTEVTNENDTQTQTPVSQSKPTTSSKPTTITAPSNSAITSSTQKPTSDNDEFSTHPGKDHVFGDETILVYPTASREGCYGKRCEQTQYGNTGGIQEKCKKVEVTKIIPKRAGDYSSIDSSFEVVFSDDDPCSNYGFGEAYKMIDIPQFSIVDERISGAVPTIVYDRNEGVIVVTAELRNGSLYTYNFDIAYITDCINDGYLVSGRISEDEIRLQVGWLTGSGG